MIGNLPAINSQNILPQHMSDEDSYDTPIEEELNTNSLISGISSSHDGNG